jgi:hypothetical protein
LGAGYQWFTPVILATQEAEIRRIRFEAKTLSQKNPSQKWVGGVAQGVGPEFKFQYRKKKTKKKPNQKDSGLGVQVILRGQGWS